MKKKHIYQQAGFTLIEILAVMMVFGIIGSIAAGTLVTTLRTSNKSSILTVVKQNGDYAISRVARIVRNAYTLKSPTLPCGTPDTPTISSSITVLDGSGLISVISCTGSNPSPPIPANTITLQQGGNPATSLLDTSLVQTAVGSSQTCYFSCYQEAKSNYPVINIVFALSQKSTSNFVEQIASASAIDFSTSVVFRNYQR